MRALVLLGILLLAGCTGPADPAPPTVDDPAPTPTATAEIPASPTTPVTPRPGGPPVFPYAPGIYFREPAPSSALRLVGGEVRAIALPPGGFDIRASALVHGDNANTLRVVFQNGTERTIRVPTLHHIGRPSFSPAGSEIVVQATLTAGEPPQNFDIFAIDLDTGATRALSAADHNEESPEWSPAGDMIAYSSFSPEEGVNLHLVRPTGAAHLSIRDAGAIHLAFSTDGARILDVGRLRILSVETGAIVEDLRDEALAALRAAGYEPDARFPGQAGRGTFPLDGAFSPDGARIVFDGAVVKDGTPGVILATMGVDGSGFEIVAGPFVVDPDATNGLNYSETNPLWR